MKNYNPFVKAANNLASDGLGVLFGVLDHEIRTQLGWPKRRSNILIAPCGFPSAVEEIAAMPGYEARWNDEETAVVLTVPIGNGSWQVLGGTRGNFVELISLTGLRFQDREVPRDLASFLLTRNLHIMFGGFELFDHEGSLLVRGRLTIPADAITADLLCTAITILAAEASEVAFIYGRLKQ